MYVTQKREVEEILVSSAGKPTVFDNVFAILLYATMQRQNVSLKFKDDCLPDLGNASHHPNNYGTPYLPGDHVKRIVNESGSWIVWQDVSKCLTLDYRDCS